MAEQAEALGVLELWKISKTGDGIHAQFVAKGTGARVLSRKAKESDGSYVVCDSTGNLMRLRVRDGRVSRLRILDP